LTENLLKNKAEDLSVIFCRLPSVGASWKEPYPGWVDTITATAAWIYSSATGYSALGQFTGARGETVPVDICCNAILASPYFYSTKRGVTVLNIV